MNSLKLLIASIQAIDVANMSEGTLSSLQAYVKMEALYPQLSKVAFAKLAEYNAFKTAKAKFLQLTPLIAMLGGTHVFGAIDFDCDVNGNPLS